MADAPTIVSEQLDKIDAPLAFFVVIALIIILVLVLANRECLKKEGCCGRRLYAPQSNTFGWVHPGAQNTPLITGAGEPSIVKTSEINNTRRVTLHYTQWCGYCKNMKPIWEQVKLATAASGILFNEIDEDVARTPGVTGYPTIIMLNERGERSKYDGPADFATLRAWVVNPVQRPM
jgi:thiol-disulfide isomerase/thioredoxin